MFRQIKSKLLAAFAVPLAILVGVAGLAISSNLSQTKSSQGRTEAAALVALGLAGALLGLLLVIRVSRAVSRPLAELASQAEHLATVSLPATVQAILDADATGGELPELPKVRVGNIEEVAGVATALEALNKTAVELAAGQAALRRNLSDAFVNLGRRNQNLVTRQLEYITEIELKEADPTSLEELFRLDHLATRMRRNAESLLILAGSGPARQWSASVPLMDVARAASAEVEDYKRLRLHHFDPGMVTGIVTTDLVHILAELIENALSFSPPAAAVDVYGRFLEGGYVIVIVDSGIGMSSEDLATANHRLEGQGADGEVPGRYLGHFVAGRLAARHGLTISLQPSHSGGLVARVKVPAHLLEETVADLSAGAEVSPAAYSATADDASALDAPSYDDADEGAGESAPSPSYEPVHNNVSAHENGFDFAGGAPAADDDFGAMAGNGVTELGAVWLSQVSRDAEAGTDAVYETNGAAPPLEDESGDYVKPFDWALPLEPSGPINAPEATADTNFVSAADGLGESAPAGAGSFIPEHTPELVEPVATVEAAAYDYVSKGTEPQREDTLAPPGEVASSISPAVADVVVDDEGARTGDMLPERGWGAMPIEALPRTPDLAASGVLAGPPKGSNGNHFRSEPEAFGITSLSEAVYAGATAPAATPASGPDGHGASSSSPASWSASLLGAPAPAPAVGPAAQARSTADALRKLTRRVPGASLPEEDDSLRRPTSMSTTSNPLGLSGALSQYLSVTVEGRPEKEHNPR